MKTLLLLRGVAGSGKSTTIKKYNLEPYTISTDAIRDLFSSPVLGLEGKFQMDMANNSEVWKKTYELVERRMRNGDFTVVDATHVFGNLGEYAKLADKYKYRVFCYTVNSTLENALKQNQERPEHKIVPEEIVAKQYKLMQEQEISSKITMVEKIEDVLLETTNNENIVDVNNYEKVVVIGDIQSCFDPLEEVLRNYNQETLYVFVGDYLDRGLQSKEVMNRLFDIYERKNVVLLEGNHDIYPWYYASDDKNNENRNFMNKTLPQMIEGLNEKEINEFKKKLRQFYRRLRQVYLFTFDSQKYIVTHGGLSLVPDHLVKISSKQLISGVGEHEDEIGKIFMEHNKENLCKGFIQIHGHRWSPSNKYSYCLEDSVEYGGNLVVLQLIKGKEPEIIKIKNNTYNKEAFYEDCGRNYIVDDKRIERMLNSYNIKVKEQPEHDLLSINFTHRAFRKGLWNTNTIKARGLFVNKDTGEVKLRSYNKFFNYEELEAKGEEDPFKFMKQPLRISKKENGFLGILSVVNNEFVLASKSQIYGEMKDYFQEVFDLVAKKYKDELFKILKENNLSVVFEVIHPKDNQHPIDYNDDYKLYLLDFFKNQIDFDEAKNPKACVDWVISEKYKNMFMENTRFSKEKTESVLSFSKDVYVYINNYEELKEVVSRYFGDNIEGAVITDREGFMFKYKTEYYNTLKYRRMLLSQIKPEPELFDFWIKMVKKQDKMFYNKIRKYKHSDLFDKTIREVNKMIEKDEEKKLESLY